MEVLNLLQDLNVHFHLKKVIKELKEPYITKTLLDFIRLSFSLNITFEFIFSCSRIYFVKNQEH